MRGRIEEGVMLRHSRSCLKSPIPTVRSPFWELQTEEALTKVLLIRALAWGPEAAAQPDEASWHTWDPSRFKAGNKWLFGDLPHRLCLLSQTAREKKTLSWSYLRLQCTISEMQKLNSTNHVRGAGADAEMWLFLISMWVVGLLLWPVVLWAWSKFYVCWSDAFKRTFKSTEVGFP